MEPYRCGFIAVPVQTSENFWFRFQTRNRIQTIFSIFLQNLPFFVRSIIVLQKVVFSILRNGNGTGMLHWFRFRSLRFRFRFTNTWAMGLGEPQQLRACCCLLLAPQLQRELGHQTVSTSTFKGLCFVWYIEGSLLFGTLKGLLCWVWYPQGSPLFGTLKGLHCLVP